MIMNFKRIIDLPNILRSFKRTFKSSVVKIDELKIQNGKILARLNMECKEQILTDLHLAEFKVFSQWGDDGIIQFLVTHLDIENKTFIEFGVEDYKEANTRFLLINNNWSGLIMDGSESHMNKVKDEEIYYKYELKAFKAFVTAENINSLITNNGFEGEIGLLHIDIDGNDYHVWKAIDCISPIIVIVEYNSVFGYEHPWTVPYDKDFFRTNYHFSNLCYGASILSLCDLAEEKGYYFIGCNSNGGNAYFIRKDKISDLKPVTAKEGYVRSTSRESRDENGKLTFITGPDRLRSLKGMKIFNTREQIVTEIK
jgi:hypothetical protein